jgi:hypothetical protein
MAILTGFVRQRHSARFCEVMCCEIASSTSHLQGGRLNLGSFGNCNVPFFPTWFIGQTPCNVLYRYALNHQRVALRTTRRTAQHGFVWQNRPLLSALASAQSGVVDPDARSQMSDPRPHIPYPISQIPAIFTHSSHVAPVLGVTVGERETSAGLGVRPVFIPG